MPQREVDEMPRYQSCGILVPVQEIVKEHNGHEVTVCSDKCLRIYAMSWYPRYGSEAATELGRDG